MLSELKQETISRVWKLFESKRKKVRELREEFQITDQPDGLFGLFPIEASLFELHLTERLLKQERLIASRRLRIDFRPGLSLSESQSRLKKPEEIYRQQKEIEEATNLARRSAGLILGEYASEIETDPGGKEFQAWALVFERLAQQFTVLFFDDDMSRIPRVITLKRPDILDKRKAMLREANLQLTSRAFLDKIPLDKS